MIFEKKTQKRIKLKVLSKLALLIPEKKSILFVGEYLDYISNYMIGYSIKGQSRR